MRVYPFKILVAAALLLSTVVAKSQEEVNRVNSGERVYTTYCLTCHGDGLVSNGTVSFDLRRLRADERPRFENAVLNGKGQMPPWKGVVSPSEMDLLWSYIRANTTAP